MSDQNISRKDLDNQEFLKLRQATGKIAVELDKRLKRHLTTLQPLFIPRKLLGTYVKSSSQQEVHGSEKAFAELQEIYSSICETPFQLPKKLQTPLPPLSNVIESLPLEYTLTTEGDKEEITISSPTRFLLAYQSECPLKRVQGMLIGKEARQPEEMRHGLLSYIVLTVFIETFPALRLLLEDLRYQVEIVQLEQFGGLPAVLVSTPLATFLPNDQFIREVTQLSGIPAFQEIIDLEALESMSDPFQSLLGGLAVN